MLFILKTEAGYDVFHDVAKYLINNIYSDHCKYRTSLN